MQDIHNPTDKADRTIIQADKFSEINDYLLDQVFATLGLGVDSLWRRLLRPLILPFVRGFVEAGQAFDLAVAQEGFQRTAQAWMAKWTPGIHLGGEVDLPRRGPLLVAANHPGSFDALALAGSIPRQDLKIVVGANPFLLAMPNTRHFFIYSSADAHARMATFRAALRHLLEGGALLLFSSGRMDPDPFYFADDARQALERWSASLDLFLRKLPETSLFVAINAGVVAPEYIGHPLARLCRRQETRQKIAEFIQTMQLVLHDRMVSNMPSVVFAQPETAAQRPERLEDVREQVLRTAKRLIDYSCGEIKALPGGE